MTMAEYIEREAAYHEICSDETMSGYEKAYCSELIRNIPAADVTPVVRCKDCEHSCDAISYLYCTHGVCVDCEVPLDFYCAEGKRKENK